SVRALPAWKYGAPTWRPRSEGGLKPVVKSLAFVPPAPWPPVTMSCRSSSTLTSVGETPIGTAPFALMVPTGRRTHWICSHPGGAPERMSCLPAVVEGKRAMGKPATGLFHVVFDSEVAAIDPKASFGPLPGG